MADIIVSKANGKTTIEYNKSVLQCADGKVTAKEVCDSILVITKIQSDRIIDKLSKGQVMGVDDVKMLKDLTEMTLKIDAAQVRDSVLEATANAMPKVPSSMPMFGDIDAESIVHSQLIKALSGT